MLLPSPLPPPGKELNQVLHLAASTGSLDRTAACRPRARRRSSSGNRVVVQLGELARHLADVVEALVEVLGAAEVAQVVEPVGGRVAAGVDVSDEVAPAGGGRLLRHHHLRVVHEEVDLQERYR